MMQDMALKLLKTLYYGVGLDVITKRDFVVGNGTTIQLTPKPYWTLSADEAKKADQKLMAELSRLQAKLLAREREVSKLQNELKKIKKKEFAGFPEVLHIPGMKEVLEEEARKEYVYDKLTTIDLDLIKKLIDSKRLIAFTKEGFPIGRIVKLVFKENRIGVVYETFPGHERDGKPKKYILEGRSLDDIYYEDTFGFLYKGVWKLPISITGKESKFVEKEYVMIRPEQMILLANALSDKLKLEERGITKPGFVDLVYMYALQRFEEGATPQDIIDELKSYTMLEKPLPQFYEIIGKAYQTYYQKVTGKEEEEEPREYEEEYEEETPMEEEYEYEFGEPHEFEFEEVESPPAEEMSGGESIEDTTDDTKGHDKAKVKDKGKHDEEEVDYETIDDDELEDLFGEE